MRTPADVEAQRTIDEEILEHESAIRELRSRRNRHSLISRLPPELLSQVFLISKGQAQTNHSNRSAGERGWLNVAAVCRIWRDVALNTPRLWTTINLRRVDSVLLMLERSKSAPLQVHGLFVPYPPDNHNHDVSHFRATTKTTMSNINRIEEIDIAFIDHSSFTHFFGLSATLCAPALRTFRLVAPLNTAPIPKATPWREMPALRSLELANLPIHPDLVLPSLPRLVRLSISNLPFHGIPTSWLIRLLRNTPDVEEIIVGCLSHDLLGESAASSKASLAKLTQLQLASTSLVGSKIFDWIDHPSSTCVSYSQAITPPEIPSDFSTLQNLCSRLTPVESDTPPTNQITIAFSPSAFVLQLSAADCTSQPNLRLSLPRPSSQSITQYIQLSASLPLLTASSLVLDTFPHLLDGPSPWTGLIPSFHQLKTLKLIRCDSTLLNALLKSPDAATPPLPALQVIIMHRCIFNFSSDKSDCKLCDTLISVVEERRRFSMPIQSLILERCEIMKETVDEIGGYVALDWDHNETVELRAPSVDEDMYDSYNDFDSVDTFS